MSTHVPGWGPGHCLFLPPPVSWRQTKTTLGLVGPEGQMGQVGAEVLGNLLEWHHSLQTLDVEEEFNCLKSLRQCPDLCSAQEALGPGRCPGQEMGPVPGSHS